MTKSEGKQRRGFASMSSEKQREIASKGGRAAHVKGTAHEWTPDEARSAGRKGAQALQVRLLEAPPAVAAVAKHPHKKPDEMIPIIEDLMKLLDGISDVYRRGKHPEPKEAKQIADLLTAVAKDLAP